MTTMSLSSANLGGRQSVRAQGTTSVSLVPYTQAQAQAQAQAIVCSTLLLLRIAKQATKEHNDIAPGNLLWV